MNIEIPVKEINVENNLPSCENMDRDAKIDKRYQYCFHCMTIISIFVIFKIACNISNMIVSNKTSFFSLMNVLASLLFITIIFVFIDLLLHKKRPQDYHAAEYYINLKEKQEEYYFLTYIINNANFCIPKIEMNLNQNYIYCSYIDKHGVLIKKEIPFKYHLIYVKEPTNDFFEKKYKIFISMDGNKFFYPNIYNI